MTPLLVLIAGPFRSGTDGDPVKAARNLQVLEQAALAVYLRGHVPMIGEWLALPLAREAGSSEPGDEISEAFLYPAAERLLSRCDALWRIDGPSRGADEDVRRAMEMGLPVYRSLSEIPMTVHSPEIN
ncbi:hypothetical protein HDE76_001132 [Rhodanobacter sp. ANJX3]|uniref:DUF4406 domain-containing protein n=2 Tax=unclassified Rhodanobacter TaxID=2621553 RepID=UPI00160BA7B3|nr:DUF4406 domain-containing protein [Rhodanobacter sp. ANJX3]MBB5357926.1 hypothetical protein [Rhodanobacter sp. ANJX3]